MAKRYNIIENNRISKKRRIGSHSSDLQLLDLPAEVLESIINDKCDYLERFVMGNVCKTFYRIFDKRAVTKRYREYVHGVGFIKWYPSSPRWRYDAAKRGYANVLNWLFEFPRGWTNWDATVLAAMRGAAKGGHVEILRTLPKCEYADGYTDEYTENGALVGISLDTFLRPVYDGDYTENGIHFYVRCMLEKYF